MGTARAADHDYLRDLGIEEPIDYRTTDFTAVVREVDLVRGENTDRSRWVLSAGGRVLAAEGPRTPPDARVDRFIVSATTAALDALAAAVDRGRVRGARRDEPADHELAAAHRRGESGGVRGKIVLTAA